MVEYEYMNGTPQETPEEMPPAVESFKREQIALLNDMYKRLTALYTFERNLIIYRLVMRGKAKQSDIAEAWGVTPMRVHQILEKFRKQAGELSEI